jgi:hypothetical protein
VGKRTTDWHGYRERIKQNQDVDDRVNQFWSNYVPCTYISTIHYSFFVEAIYLLHTVVLVLLNIFLSIATTEFSLQEEEEPL